MTSQQQLESAVLALAEERFGADKVAKTEVSIGRDHDGDDVIFVTIILNAAPKQINAGRLSEFTRYLRSRFADLGEQRYPYTNFTSQSDAGVAA